MRSHPSPANSHQSGPMLEALERGSNCSQHRSTFPLNTGGTRPFNPSGSGRLFFALRCNSVYIHSVYLYAYVCTLVGAMLHFFLVSGWCLCTSPACKCLNHRAGVRPHIQQRSAFLISFHLHSSALFDPQYRIPRGGTPVCL